MWGVKGEQDDGIAAALLKKMKPNLEPAFDDQVHTLEEKYGPCGADMRILSTVSCI